MTSMMTSKPRFSSATNAAPAFWTSHCSHCDAGRLLCRPVEGGLASPDNSPRRQELLLVAQYEFTPPGHTMQYPLTMRFKILAFAPQIAVTDASGEEVCYVRQKMFRFREAVVVFKTKAMKDKLCDIKADRIIDWSASYHFTDTSGETFGAVRRKGMRSIWKAHYEILDESDQQFATVSEENPMAKVFDALLGEIPVVGLLTGYVFQPRYLVNSTSGTPMLRLEKQRGFLESRFVISKLAELDPVEELRTLMSLLMMTLLERRRG
jgi:hypothetical protein